MKTNRILLITATFVGLFISSCSNDDNEPMIPGITVSAAEDTYSEGDGTITVTFTSNETFTNNVTVNYEVTGTATEGEDFEALSGSLTLNAGENSITESLTFIDDEDVEQQETIIISVVSVDGETDLITSDSSITLNLNDNDSFAYENGILVMHEGNFFGGNASISFVTNDLSTVSNDIFNEVNQKALGDTAQSMGFDGDLAYIVVNNSQTVEVVNRYNFESLGTVDADLLNPRYIAFANGKGYVTNWGDGGNPVDDFVAVINLEDYTVESTISVPEGPEWIVANGNTLYVAHQGGFNQNNIVSVIDATTNMLGTPITVADRPNSMQLIGEELWVLSGGNPAFTGNETAGQLDKINTTTNTVDDTFEFAVTEHPNYLSADGNTLYYLLGGEVYTLATTDNALPTSAIITGVSFYDMSVNEGRLYGVDAKDFASNGSLEVYDLSSNSLLESLEVSLIPGAVYFNGSFGF